MQVTIEKLVHGGFVLPGQWIIVDPPRLGMSTAVRNAICSQKLKRIISVSCDLATHPRDLAHLVTQGKYMLS